MKWPHDVCALAAEAAREWCVDGDDISDPSCRDPLVIRARHWMWHRLRERVDYQRRHLYTQQRIGDLFSVTRAAVNSALLYEHKKVVRP